MLAGGWSRVARVVGVDARAALVLALSLALALSGCTCKRKPDEEVLKQRIDTWPVHLYLASKAALVSSDGSPSRREAKEQTDKAVQAAMSGERPDALGTMGALAKALWSSRDEGKQLLHAGDDKLVLPGLVGDGALGKVLDANLEHTLLLGALFVTKYHPASPAPVPDEVLLYEASRADADKLSLPGLGPLGHAMKAVVYGTNDLCDLGKREAEATSKGTPPEAALGLALTALFGERAKTSVESTKKIYALARASANGVIGACYLQRGETRRAAEELGAFVREAHTLGVPTSDTALVRAFIAHEKGDEKATVSALEEARAAAEADEKAELDELLALAKGHEKKKLDEAFSRSRLAVAVASGLVKKLGSDELLGGLSGTRLGRALGALASVTGGAARAARSVIPSLNDAKEMGDSVRRRVFR
jgi:hypothetical protein